ncbi:MAG TPA: TonB-dependent receptor [Spirochaetota bacterium]|nr:TonB-dependent receptor [Spirochaetota bacterium]HPI91007.1 TonB-dependent receptor [Spirochaetota bacterium]HPR48612.1 TonB-dependent receptor [Spirochaetota bacterium]
MNHKIALFVLAGMMSFIMTWPLSAQERIFLQGKVYSTVDKKPVEFATVALIEAKVKTRTDQGGGYSLAVPERGTYTLIIRAAGLKMLKTSITIMNSATRDFWLQPVTITGGALTIVGERDIQKVSRYTMTARELKDVPASLGDSVSALTALPGIIRTAGFFGNLVIRGASDMSNRYYVDEMPLYNPLHFGGLHSVIANELISEIDLYSSAFPAKFGGPTAAVININTMDDVKEFGGWADIGLISATALVKIPITKEVLKDENFEKEIKGYVIISGRYGYLTLFIPLFYELIVGEKLNVVPEYWDYQVKAKYYFDSRNSLTLLAFGSRDYLRLVNDEKGDSTVDPLLEDFQIRTDTMSFTQGLTYTYRPGKKFSNDLIAYASLNEGEFYTNIDSDQAASWTKGYNNKGKPYIYGLKDLVRIKWLDNNAELRMGADVTLYNFTYKGYIFLPDQYRGYGIPDFANENEFTLKPIENSILNIVAGGYIENKFTWKGLTVVPGVRMDYLNRSDFFIADPRLLISYEFESDTTLSVAGGMYSSFYQVNPYLFTQAQYIAEIGKGLKPERAAHSVLGIEQKIFLFTLKIEGFFNYFWDVGVESEYLDNSFDNSGQLMAYGVEALLRLDRSEKAAGFFGWINYTFTQSKWRSGHPDVYVNTDKIISDGGRFINYDYEQEHALKLVLGYTIKQHTISGKFQLYTSFPYTPITGSIESPAGSGRYFPTYQGVETNSRHFPVNHRLDLRYTYTSRHEWGQVSWYIELINAYYYIPINRETWRYNQPYEKGTNPKLERDETALALIPNFGVEIKF